VFTESKWRQGRLVAILGALEEVNIEARCDAAGLLSIKRMSISGFRMVRVPRVWDDPDRRNAEKGAATELFRLAQRFKHSLEEWSTSIGELARWIRYTPPPSDATPVASPSEEQEDEDGGPETIH
jgi:hypothetical protein